MAESEKNSYTDKESTASERQIITFKLGDEVFGLDIKSVRRIAQLEPSSIVPRAPDFITGIMNLGGSIITLINLSKILKIPGEESFEQVIILKNETMQIGILTGFITDVIAIDEDSKEEGLIGIDSQESDISFVSGVFKVGEKIVNILYSNKIFDFVDDSISVSRAK